MNYHYQPEMNFNGLQQFDYLDTLNRQQQQPYGQPYGQPYYPPRPPRCRWVRECRWVRRCGPRDDFSPYDYDYDNNY
jgi:hypothetical protein